MTTTALTHTTPAAFFGTYEIRAIVSETFNTPQYRRVGLAFATWLKSHHPMPENGYWVAVGYDARTHSPQLEAALVEGLTQGGLNVVRLGLCPTPAVYYAEFESQMANTNLPALVGTLTVTASHNPAEYNGLKMTYGCKILDKKALLEVKAIYLDQLHQPLPQACVGSITPVNWLPHYLEWLIPHGHRVKIPMKIVIDSGNATGGLIAPALFEALGCQVISLFESPDGTFPNHHPDPSTPKNLKQLIKSVLMEQADFGIAFDGDSDRLGVVDSQGRLIPGDILLLLFARHYAQTRQAEDRLPVVVTEVKCSQTLLDEVAAVGGRVVMAPTGHAFIKAAMRQHNAVLGGELSGHFFFTDHYLGFDDAFYAAMRFLDLVVWHRTQNHAFTTAQLLDALPQTHLSEEHRMHCPVEIRQGVMEHLHRQLVGALESEGIHVKDLITIDGLRVVLEGGFVLIRPSNTEPVLSIRTETPCPEVEAKLDRVLETLLSELIPQGA